MSASVRVPHPCHCGAADLGYVTTQLEKRGAVYVVHRVPGMPCLTLPGTGK